jgi:hypothetical protein
LGNEARAAPTNGAECSETKKENGTNRGVAKLIHEWKRKGARRRQQGVQLVDQRAGTHRHHKRAWLVGAGRRKGKQRHQQRGSDLICRVEQLVASTKGGFKHLEQLWALEGVLQS